LLRKPPRLLIEPIVRAGLLEDLSHGGDLTTDAIVAATRSAQASFVTRDAGVIAGIDCAAIALELLDPHARVTVHRADGERAQAGERIASVESNARALLTAERTALNLLCRLSGVATATRELVDAIAHTRAQVVCTRKTIPGLRVLQKYAVRCGGGSNHRFGLDDAVLIKDNHIALAGSVAKAVEAARIGAGHLVKIELEVDTLDQLLEAVALPIDAVLLDNMSPDMLREAVSIVRGRMLTEASGRVTPRNIAAIAESGVDLISSGWLTQGAPALDIGLDITI
jgi:nicotinate-nucleotide pyrophosphorylase (carboxylating)